MHTAHKVVTLSLGVASFVALFLTTAPGCGDSGSGGNGGGGSATCLKADGCYDYTCYKAGPTRSFKADVLPIFEQSCSLSNSCHGNPNSPTTTDGYQPYLGAVDPEVTPSDTAKIISLIVNQKSPTATEEMIVAPGSPETSFLMQKMDGAVDCASVKCTFSECGDSMPQGVDPLPKETRDAVRDWIKQGAQNN